MAARNTPTAKAWRSLGWLGAIIAGLLLLQTAGALFWGWGWTPKLALDLEGGTQVILTATLEDGQEITQEQLDQSVSIIRSRIDAAGVAESEITTQGGDKIVVSIPGEADQATLDRIKQSAKLEFRAVLAIAGPDVVPPAEGAEALEDTPATTPENASDLAWITPALESEFLAFDCSTIDDSGANVAPADKPLITCADDGTAKYLLGPAEVQGATIEDALAQVQTTSTGVSRGSWAVVIDFNDEGTKQFADVTTRLFGLTGVQNQFAIVLDGKVISAPTTNAVISDGRPEISGSFTQDGAKALADQLKFGALPVGFAVESQEQISATLGSSQLTSGLVAGLIGLLLVFLYSLFQYRLLGTVTIMSLLVAGIITYLVVNIMSFHYGYRLSLAGVAGLIVAIGFTADSFIVYFERIRDELRDGRSLTGAVEAGWKRALRTVLAAKSVNLLSAIILFIMAVGSVRGFALTLGVTTIIDVLIVILFTHPVMQLLATTRFFASGHPLSGLDPNALGAVYRGRAEFRLSTEARRAGASREAQRRQTIAERKAAELAAASSSTTTSTSDKKKGGR
ncbi:protein translocase subunit SecD [Salinibacterium sp. ZJ70]|uniref:protein translocase subunit SecD n=1 Tax=Salinibacterium sp. ZJ70 TaxID=2708084 RepID=UPI001420FB1E|nr:protein translocase subunit SecD [Salinibacterium sp. ZJ70]